MDSEYYTNSTESYSPEQINNKTANDFFLNTAFISKDSKQLYTDKEIEFNIHQLLKPNETSNKKNYYENVPEYVPKQTNPYEVIMKLKCGLAEVKNDIDTSAKNFKDLSIVTNLNSDSYASYAFDQITNSKKSIDAFINYNLFNKEGGSDNDSKSDSGSESEGDKQQLPSPSTEVKEDKDKDKPKYYSSYERYNRLSENLLSQIKQIENDLVSGTSKDSKIEYEILMTRVTETEDLTNHMNALEDRITHIEKTVGKWDLIDKLDNLSKYITNLVYYNEELANSNDHKKRYETLKMINDLFSDFDKDYKKNLKVAHVYVKIIEAYRYYELSLEYQSELNNIKKRLKAIKSVCTASNQLKDTLMLLKAQVDDNEVKYEELSINYTQTLALFKVLESMMPELDELDKSIKSKIK